MPKVYLAGPISNITYEQAAGWRDKTEQAFYETNYRLSNPKWVFLNPLLKTDVDHVNKDTGVFGNGHELDAKISDMFFVRDMDWVKQADIILADFTIVPPKLGGGTPYELGAAFAWNKMVIVVGPKENIPLFCLKGASIHFETLDQAIAFMRTL